MSDGSKPTITVRKTTFVVAVLAVAAFATNLAALLVSAALLHTPLLSASLVVDFGGLVIAVIVAVITRQLRAQPPNEVDQP
ncbi:hypothetical protein F1C58_16200 (plasmid) [Glaciihabitans sp. INWT7]|uniref:hypothetical protein n=1 Tax=Glaciihabitans sp. INWT7 TaxID=2596912 RepID=UPI001627AC21|nr:hypothetical protein [Glaciihabitans sp. INWT7]QNE48601.1 hypothetical protein F1C58_16200 [Glaciihabitans sp. INWT7]